jgi:CRP/FNR family transcriptional regulator
MLEYTTEYHILLFPRFAQCDVKLLLSLMKEVSLDKGDILFSSGDSGSDIFFVVEGRLAVQKRTGFGDRTQAIALLDPGAPVGERALLGTGKHSATLLAVEKTLLFSLSYQNFAEIKEASPLLAVSLLELTLERVSLRLEKSSDRLSHVL